jgi:hypothetical protein
MTTFTPSPNTDGLVKLSGIISNLKVKRDNASFVFTQSDQTKMGVIAIAASFAGLGGQAMSSASNAGAIEEEADYLEFDLDDVAIKGWVWRSPFREGDAVTIAAEKNGSQFEAFGIKRSHDKTIALYPHCSRSKLTHYKNAIKWWAIGGVTSLCLIGIPMGLYVAGMNPIAWKYISFTYLALMVFFALMTYSLARKWMPFVALAEKVFRALELPNPSNVDLVKSSKAQRTDKDPGEFGTFYFRY